MPNFKQKGRIFVPDPDGSLFILDNDYKNRIGSRVKLEHETDISRAARYAWVVSDGKLIAMDVDPSNKLFTRYPEGRYIADEKRGTHRIRGVWPFYVVADGPAVSLQYDGSYSETRVGDLIADIQEIDQAAERIRRRGRALLRNRNWEKENKTLGYRSSVNKRKDTGDYRWNVYYQGKRIKTGLCILDDADYHIRRAIFAHRRRLTRSDGA